MNGSSPHYLLFSQAGWPEEPCRWRFALRTQEGEDLFTVDDVEPRTRGQRLELLTVLRGLEALDQPSRVTLMTPSSYVREGIHYGVGQWRKNGWCWEAFGQMVPVRNRDLWQRLDRVMQFHQIECRTWRFDPPHEKSVIKKGNHIPHKDAANAPLERLAPYWAARYMVGWRRRASQATWIIKDWLARTWKALMPHLRFG